MDKHLKQLVTKAEYAFAETWMVAGKLGRIEGGFGGPLIRLTSVTSTASASEDVIKSYACEPGAPAILVEYAEVDLEVFGPVDSFPREFNGIIVLYAQE